MRHTCVLWNLVNLIDAEGAWFLRLIVVLFAAGFASGLLKKGIEVLHLRFEAKHMPWQDAFIRAIVQPFNVYLWVVVIVYSVNLVTDSYLSEQFSCLIKIFFSISAVLSLTWFLLRWKNNLVQMFLEKQKKEEYGVDAGMIYGFGKLATALIIAICVLFLMEVTGVNVQTLLAFGGISGLALAIASQDIVGNFFGGFMIYINRPFAVGDLIRLPSSNLEGYVEDIGWYQTSLRTSDKKPVYVPNALFSKAYVINDSRKTHRRIKEEISIRHSDLFLAPKIIEDLLLFLQTCQGIDTSEKVSVNISHISPYAVEISLSAMSYYIDETQFLALRDLVFLKIGESIEKHGAKIATRPS